MSNRMNNRTLLLLVLYISALLISNAIGWSLAIHWRAAYYACETQK